VTEAGMLVFHAKPIQVGQCTRDKQTDYLSRAENYYTSSYSDVMKRDRFFHFHRFLHFTNNKNEPDVTDKNSDRLWKMRHLFDNLNEKFRKFYSPSEHIAVDDKI
jgi:predicted patatin/cPLA2 family phospholipase